MPVVAVVKSDLAPEAVRENTKRAIDLAGGFADLIENGDKVLIKPNFVAPLPYATTDLNVIRCVVNEIRKCGGEPIIGESSGFEFDTEWVFKIIGITKLAEELNVKLVNFDKEKFIKIKIQNFPVSEILLPEMLLDVKKIINMPKLKMHKQTNVSLGMKNLMGLPHRESRRLIHILGLEKNIAALSNFFNPIFNVVDGLIVPKEGAVYGKFDTLGLILAGRDTLAIDNICCRILGVNPETVPYISLANKAHFFNLSRVKVVGDYDKNEILVMSITNNHNKFSKTIYKLLARGMYLFDYLYSRLTPRRSLIPYFNLKFGIRPKVVKSDCYDLQKCIDSCPVGAISGNPLKIDYRKCMHVRCLKCISECSGSIVMQSNKNK